MGRMPRTLWGAIAEFFITLGALLYGGLIFLVNCFIELGKWIAGVFGALVGAIAEAAMAIIEAVIKAAVLVLIYLLFAVSILALTIALLLILPFAFLMSLFFACTVEYVINRISMVKDGETIMAIGYDIMEEYVEFLDLHVHYIKFYFDSADTTFKFNVSLFSFYVGFVRSSTSPNSAAQDYVPLQKSYTNTLSNTPNTSDLLSSVAISADLTSIVEGQFVEFTPTITGGNPPFQWTWDFGDGTPVVHTQGAVTHQYTTATGSPFTATLTIEDADGTTASDTEVIAVSSDSDPIVHFTTNATTSIDKGQ